LILGVFMSKEKRFEIEIFPLKTEDCALFKKDMQDAFQFGFEVEFGPSTELILPEKDIDSSMQTNGSIAFKAVMDGTIVGGAIVVIDSKTQKNQLHFLYVKVGYQGKGIGYQIWNQIEKTYPKTEIWETHTPYFEKRNIHFYVNKCGFHIVEFYCPWHKDSQEELGLDGGMANETGDYFFRFEKKE